MKKFNFKTRMQVGWFKAAMFGTVVGILLAPTAGKILTDKEKAFLTENPLVSAISSISFGPKIKVMINGDVVALAPSEEAAQNAYKQARLAYNAKGIRALNIDVTYAEADKEKDAKAIEGKKVLKSQKLEDAILKSFDNYADADKRLAYTMRVDDHTVTVEHMADVISILEQAQNTYDSNNQFQVGLKPPASRNVTMYEVEVEDKNTGKEASEEVTTEATTATPDENSSETEAVTEEGSAENTDTENTSEATTEVPLGEDDVTGVDGIVPIPEKTQRYLTGEESTTEVATQEGESASEETQGGDSEETSTEAAGEDTENSSESTEAPADTEEATTQDSAVAEQGVDDGVKYVGFADTIQVMETYVNASQIKDKDTAYTEMTTKNAEAGIYVVEPGDALSIIAEKNNISVDEIKELNPQIESDDDIYYDDRLNITVPKAALQILVEKQETYKESYNEDVVYQDDDSMFIGETEVVQEGTPGSHVVTDLVTYKDDVESERENLKETVEVAAVAEVVKRGTKSKPTYMYPVTNWNLTSNFGYRWGRLHAGADVGVPIGTTVRASRAGQVITAGWVGGYGNCVIIDHGDGVTTRYGHLSEVTVSVGQYVDQGQQVALSGNTGRSTGPHLHFEIRINGEAVDPLPYLAGEK
ncbi:MAG: peptidoglycan DD-metalloendopeptidase family protein [Clostridium sp.]|nr:peptidoglycan DD-metalloendopeptidase family protein [Clostridium sp.]